MASRALCAAKCNACIAGDVRAAGTHSRGSKNGWPVGSEPMSNGLGRVILSRPRSRKIYLVHRPDSVQTTVALGNIAIERRSPDYIPMVVMNHILGGGVAGRLFLKPPRRERLHLRRLQRLQRSALPWTLARRRQHANGSHCRRARGVFQRDPPHHETKPFPRPNWKTANGLSRRALHCRWNSRRRS